METSGARLLLGSTSSTSNTELRVAWRRSLEDSLTRQPNEVVPPTKNDAACSKDANTDADSYHDVSDGEKQGPAKRQCLGSRDRAKGQCGDCHREQSK